MSSLEKEFKNYYQTDINTNKFLWIQKPFDAKMDSTDHLPISFQEEFADLSCNSNLKIEFGTKSVPAFWLGLKKEYPLLSNSALSILLPFATTYLCETAFSVMTNIKTKQRTRLENIEVAMRPALTKIAPRFNLLCQNKQAHPSH